jgi:hypothetical protein
MPALRLLVSVGGWDKGHASPIMAFATNPQYKSQNLFFFLLLPLLRCLAPFQYRRAVTHFSARANYVRYIHSRILETRPAWSQTRAIH